MTRRHPFSFLLLLLAFLLPMAVPAAHRGFYVHPDIHGDMIVFSSEGDLWRVSVAGGVAVRLTSDAGIETHPRISPDGRTIAFAGQYDGNLDVYTMPMEGGVPRRLTWHPLPDIPSGWTPDGAEILYFTPAQHPHSERETFVVPAGGGVPRRLPIGSSSYASIAPDGRSVVFNRAYVQTRTWKRYGGGLADDVWFGDLENAEFRRLTEYFGNDLSPFFAGDRIFFLSERDGRMNLWSVDWKGKDLTQHTRLDGFDVRQPQGDGGSQVVFQHGADIHLYNVADGSSRVVDIVLPSDRARLRPQLPSPSAYIDDFDISDDGRKTLLAARGELFNIPAKEGRPIPLTQSQGVRETRVAFAGAKDEYAVYFSDRTGEYGVYRALARTGAEEAALSAPADHTASPLQPFLPIEVSPDGEHLAFADPDGNLFVTGVTTPTLALAANNRVWEIREYDWSPDGRYLAYAASARNEFNQIHVFDMQTSATHTLTSPMFDSFSPSWDPDGKYLFFISARTLKREGGAFEYETVMVDPMKIYGIALNKDARNPFLKKDPYEEDEEKGEEGREKGEEGKEKGEEGKGKGEGEKEEERKPVEVDFDGIEGRIFEFPMDSGDYTGLVAARERVFYFDSGGKTSDLKVFVYTAEKPEAKVFAADVKGYAFSRNRGHLVYRVGDVLRTAKADAEKAGEEDPTPAIATAHLEVDPATEWRQIFEDARRFNRDYFYSPTLGNVDWEHVADVYRPLLDRLSTRQELNDVIGSLIGELGHGHTYVWGEGDAPGGRTVPTGLPGADFDVDPGRKLVRLARIYRGEPWNAAVPAPLGTERTAAIAEGSYLLAVNGRPVTPDMDPLSHFWGRGKGEEVLLTIGDPSDPEKKTDYRVALVEEDISLRRLAWVEGRRQYVAEKSGGRLGYLYLPNMGDEGLYRFFREYYPQIDREGMVVDVRWNGGGNVSQMIIRRLSEELYAMMTARDFEHANTYPARVFQGPMACLVNQRCGSDGDIFASSFRRFELGPLIGTRTWGGTIGIRFHARFADGGQVTIPEFAFVDKELGYEIENHGVAPDKGFEVENRPEDEAAGRDPQLDRAIEHLLKEMGKKRKRPLAPPVEYPDRSTESFRERSEDWMRRP